MTDKSYRIADAAIAEVIRKYCRDLTAEAAAGKLDAYVSADDAAEAVMQSLYRTEKKPSVCITSEAGMGAGGVFETVAKHINEGRDLPPSLVNARVIAPQIATMAAGAKFRGHLGTNMKILFDGLGEREGMFEGRKIVMAVDDLQPYLKLGSGQGLGLMFGSFATAKGVCVLALGTADFCAQKISGDRGLSRRFNVLDFKPDDSSRSLVKAFTEGAAHEISVRAPITFAPKTRPASNKFP